MTDLANVVVTYLELRAPARGAGETSRLTPAPFVVHRERSPMAARVALALYRRVGGPWHWTDRLGWTEAQWQTAIDRDDVELHVARIGEEIIGYYELCAGAEAVELSYFGLLPEYTGRGLGPRLLLAAVDRAWALGRDRMTVNTCTLDHPAALATYLGCGFAVVRTEARPPVASS